MKSSTLRAIRFTVWVALAGALPATQSQAVPINFSPGEELFLGFDANLNEPFGVRYLDRANLGGQLNVEYRPGSPLGPNQKVQPGFVLVDGSLEVMSTLDDGRARARYQLRYDGRALGRMGIFARDLRLMRLDARRSTWVRARRLLVDQRARQRARMLFFFGRRAIFELGSFGVDTERSLVWGVMDVDGTYAIGALQVPEPMTVALVATGLTGVAVGRWRRGRNRHR